MGMKESTSVRRSNWGEEKKPGLRREGETVLQNQGGGGLVMEREERLGLSAATRFVSACLVPQAPPKRGILYEIAGQLGAFPYLLHFMHVRWDI